MNLPIKYSLSFVAGLFLIAVTVFVVRMYASTGEEAVTGPAQYNCELSGGTFENGQCACQIEEELGQIQEKMYDENTGFCQSTAGGPAGDALRASVGLPYGEYDYYNSIITDLCRESGGKVSGAACQCPEGRTYWKESGRCEIDWSQQANADGGRTLIPRRNIEQFKDELPDPSAFEKVENLHFDVSEQTAWAPYTNVEKGIRVEIPYNPIWGAPEYRLAPYELDGNVLWYGPVYGFFEGGGAWDSGMEKMKFLPAQTMEQTVARLKHESDLYSGEPGYGISTSTVHGKEVVEYNVPALCGGGGTVVIGEKYNYELSTPCFSNTREDIIQTMEFID